MKPLEAVVGQSRKGMIAIPHFELANVQRNSLRFLRGSLLLLGGLFLASGYSFPQQTTAGKASFPLFLIDKTCACVATRSSTETAASSEITIRKQVFQVFRDNRTERELFRVHIGGPGWKWWHYGIAGEADFNGDGVQDYAWYGGDDTFDALYVFLSFETGYRRLDIYKTLQHGWVRTSHSAAPDFADFDCGYSVSEIKLLRDSTGLSLLADVLSDAHPNAPPRHIRVASSDFIYSER